MTAASGADRQCRACGAPDHPSGCAADLPNILARASGADQPTLRDQLADELARHQALLGPMDDARPDVWQARCECGWDGGDHTPDWKRRYRQHVVDALLPLIEHAKAEAGAQALEQAADWLWDDNTEAAAAYHYLTDRAASLRAGAGPC